MTSYMNLAFGAFLLGVLFMPAAPTSSGVGISTVLLLTSSALIGLQARKLGVELSQGSMVLHHAYRLAPLALPIGLLGVWTVFR